MKAITVALEATPNGDPIREVFTMVHDSIESAEQWQKSLPKAVKSGSFKAAWAKPRVRKVESILKRGNILVAKSFLF